MKIVVFGPERRAGALRDRNVVDLSYGCAKYLREREGEPRPLEMAEALVPSDLARLMDGSSAPERFLKPGDLVEMKSPAIGSLRTRVIAKNK
jgi:hypothetical protein